MRVPAEIRPSKQKSTLSGLHLEDLALAVACAQGHEAAWDHFVAEYRAPMDRAASAIDPVASSDLSDSLYAELFGLDTRGGERKSLFRYFHGRSRLGTWLRADTFAAAHRSDSRGETVRVAAR